MTEPSASPRGILAIGANSFFARCWATTSFARQHVRFLHHGEIHDSGTLSGVRTVVSFVRQTGYDARDISDDEDANAQIARRLATTNGHLVLLSSRQVYGESERPHQETDAPCPKTVGARNRLRTEQRVLDALGKRVTILRCANMFGFELVPGRTRFMAVLLGDLLRSGSITLTVSGKTRKDFLPDTAVSAALSRVAAKPLPGIFNLGSGIGIPMRTIADAVIDGFGDGNVVEASQEVRDAFVLDTSRWKEAYGGLANRSEILARCRDLGEALRLVSMEMSSSTGLKRNAASMPSLVLRGD